MPMTALERRAAFKAAVTLREITMAEAATTVGVSYNHLMLVLAGVRKGSVRLESAIAAFVGVSVAHMFGVSPEEQ